MKETKKDMSQNLKFGDDALKVGSNVKSNNNSSYHY
jgi:hypothetical protein